MRSASIVVFLLLSCVTCFAQTSFQGLTPGVSTCEDVERVLGKPLRENGTIAGGAHLEYSPPPGLAATSVVYRHGMPIVEDIIVFLVKPVSRAALLQKFRLPAKPNITRVIGGELRESFGEPALLVLVYSGTNQATGGAILHYLSRESFANDMRAEQGFDIPAIKGSVVSLAFYEGGEVPPPEAERTYSNRFARSQTRGVWWAASVATFIAAADRRTDYELEWVIYLDGKVYKRATLTYTYNVGWTSADPGAGLWWKEPGQIPAGSYIVEVLAVGRKVGSSSFEVY